MQLFCKSQTCFLFSVQELSLDSRSSRWTLRRRRRRHGCRSCCRLCWHPWCCRCCCGCCCRCCWRRRHCSSRQVQRFGAARFKRIRPDSNQLRDYADANHWCGTNISYFHLFRRIIGWLQRKYAITISKRGIRGCNRWYPFCSGILLIEVRI